MNILRLFSALRRRAWLFAAVALSGIGMGVLYVSTATPLYTASVTVMVDQRQVRAVHDVSTLADPLHQESAEVVETQAEVIRSQKVGLAVIKNLNLQADDPAFPTPSRIDLILGSITEAVRKIVGSSGAKPEANQEPDRNLQILLKLSGNLRVERVGHTFVLQINYTAASPSRAAEIANAYANAYMVEQLSLAVEQARSARQWLQQRSEELRQLSLNADLAVQTFKSEHNLLSTRGTLTSEQQYNEMLTQLVNARAATAQAKARYERIKSIIDKHQTEAAVAESLSNPVINGLRTKYLEASRRMTELQAKLGLDHIAVVNLKNTMAELSSLLFQEFGQIADSYRNDYEIAAGREKALNAELAREQSIAIAANDAQVKLRQLQQKAETYKRLYQTFLQRYQESGQQESFPLADAHIISTASPPLEPSHPRKALVLGLSLMLGVLGGAGAAALREFTDYVFRTTEQVRAELGVDVLGLVPFVSTASSEPIMRYVIDSPLSAFAETLRLAKVAADLALPDRSQKIIGMVSLLPNEGKSTVAKNFASLLAFHGAPTLLIDADTRNPALTRALGYETRKSSRYRSPALPPLAEVVRYEPQSGLLILPAIYDKDDPRAAEGLTAATLHTLLKSSDRSFEYIVIDLPPIGPVASARSIVPAIDAFIFVVEWGATSRGAVRAALTRERLISEKLLGVVLNKVDMEELKKYEHFASDGYYNHMYETYYKREG